MQHGVSILPANSLVSRGARERWLRWNYELQQLELEQTKKDWDPARRGLRKSTPVRSPKKLRISSPASSQRSIQSTNSPSNLGFKDYSPSPDGSNKDDQDHEMETDNEPQHLAAANMIEDHASDTDADIDPDYADRTFGWLSASRDISDDSTVLVENAADACGNPQPSKTTLDESPISEAETKPGVSEILEPSRRFGDLFMEQDDISDTVGAIAIDCHGNIAAGSSSGGIGMKHGGRTGPAALVGVGTAVVPVDRDDESATSTAAVTSGTGEHMATTTAAGVFADRIYTSSRKVVGQLGALEMVTEDEALKAVIEHEFMGMCSGKLSLCFFDARDF